MDKMLDSSFLAISQSRSCRLLSSLLHRFSTSSSERIFFEAFRFLELFFTDVVALGFSFSRASPLFEISPLSEQELDVWSLSLLFSPSSSSSSPLELSLELSTLFNSQFESIRISSFLLLKPISVSSQVRRQNVLKEFFPPLPPFRLRKFRVALRVKPLGCPRNARVKFAEELGTMSKNRLRWITLVRGPIWGIHSLTLMISWQLYDNLNRSY